MYRAHTVLYKLIITFCLSANLCFGAAPEQLRFKRLLVGELSERAVRFGPVQAIEQDSDGFMWLGSEYGLARFDSHDFTFYYANKDSPHSLSSNFIYDLHKDKFGNLWVATNNGLNRYTPETGGFQHYFHESFEFDTIASNVVQNIAEYNDGTLIFATPSGLSLLRPQTQVFLHYRHKPSNPDSLSDNAINTVYVDSKNRLWAGTKNSGLNRLDVNTQGFKKWSHISGQTDSLPNNGIQKIVEDGLGRIWVASHRGHLSRLNEDDQTFTHYFNGTSNNASSKPELSTQSITDLHTDPKGRLWVATDHGGLALYDELNDRFRVFRHNPYDLTSLSSNQLRSVYGDTKGNLWVGNFPTGINFYEHSKGAIRTLKHLPNDTNTLSHNGVLCLFQDSRDLIWIGTEGGLNSFDPSTGVIRRYQHEPDNPQSLRSDIIISIDEDSKGNLWIGSWSGGLHRMSLESQIIERIELGENSVGDYLWQVRVDHKDKLWLTTTDDSGLLHYDPEAKTLKGYTHDPDNPASTASSSAYALEFDSNLQLWLGTTKGLNLFNSNLKKFIHFPSTPANPNRVADESITAINEDSHNRIWVGTQEGNLSFFDLGSQKFKSLNIQSRIRGGRIASILEDRSKNIWVGTANGLLRLNANAQVDLSLSKADGLAGNNHNRNAALISSQGLLYFGSTEGVSIFNPNDIHPNDDLPTVTLTQLRIANETVKAGDKYGILKKSIEYTNEITLQPEHSMFALKFSALNYVSSNQSQFKYKLEGFDKDWYDIGYNRTATYTNIPPGHYTFRVMASSQQGKWGDNERQLTINVLPPPWLSPWAKGLYLLAAALLLCLPIILRQHHHRRINNTAVSFESSDKKMMVNIAKDLKNEIHRLAEHCKQGIEELKAGRLLQAQQGLESVIYDSTRLTATLNNVLDQAQIETNELHLTRSAVSLFDAAQSACLLVQALARTHQVTINNTINTQASTLFTDENRLQQIFLNLLHNAIAVSAGHSVTVSANIRETLAEIEILGSSQLTPDDVKNSHLTTMFSSAMFSLSVSQSLIRFLGGEFKQHIKAGQVLKYTFTQPLYRDCLQLPENKVVNFNSGRSNDDHEEISKKSLSLTPSKTHKNFPEISQPAIKSPKGPQNKATVLIVDDDYVNRLVLSNILQVDGFVVLEAANGSEAVDIVANNSRIDLIIMDIMMPVMSGPEACLEIRKTEPKDQLPIIFLTAKNLDSETNSYLQCGANGILTKPLDKEVLRRTLEEILTAPPRDHSAY